jgi:hypothetical protein
MCEMGTMGLDGTRRHEKNDTTEALAGNRTRDLPSVEILLFFPGMR